ncbi:hypothetical protein GLOTRDRAFT_112295 [Gloeophyllum trabeum ATCC 11539]|uniref:Uncharacterized protein n=1 Tax=Gloeophyllum trabeum (strain ATCC 11539 / FP-39264 / Madison 617) TaxID=670483 RepID=S7PW42_GLOTA|nr:uncharacterized protein GLOTRDRAFT_112295 [Gloeophyllum trabeum ATCC 11539]EPQ51738.1 hypothetical protein GLOTRDRAFT_112295 [Gloeophyllum trabeum ATCC 11539]
MVQATLLHPHTAESEGIGQRLYDRYPRPLRTSEYMRLWAAVCPPIRSTTSHSSSLSPINACACMNWNSTLAQSNPSSPATA